MNDAHGPMRNLLLEHLHPQARLIKGRPKPMTMLEGLDAGYDAVLCVGFRPGPLMAAAAEVGAGGLGARRAAVVPGLGWDSESSDGYIARETV